MTAMTPAELLAALPAADRERLRASGPLTDAPLMKATMAKQAFSDPEWIYERKLDGIRCLGIRDGKRVTMLSRNNHDLSARFPEVRDALTAQSATRFAVDGEVVAFAGGQTSFSRLSARGQHHVPVFLYCFDILWLDGQDVRGLPLRARKRLLRGALTYAGALRLTPHRNRDGEAIFADACRKGWEGVVAKRADAEYTDQRSRDWLKFKCQAGQELVVGGFTAPKGSRTDFGALLVGYHQDGELRYAGKVGTGYDQATLTELGARLRALQVADAPFADATAIREAGITWVRPELVAEIGFAEWTTAGRLRQPRFQGLRDDKSARDVVREQ